MATTHSPQSPSAADSGASTSALPRSRAAQGCARGWALAPGDFATSLDAAAQQCVGGLVPALPEAADIVVEPTHPVEVPFAVDAPSACLRALGVVAEEGIELSLYARNEMLGGAFATDRLVVAPADGPVCVRNPSGLRLVVSRLRSAGRGSASSRAMVNVWVAKGE